MSFYYALFALIAFFYSFTEATYGVDYSTYISSDSIRCMVNNGYNFAIPRVYMSVGRPDPNGAQNVINAWNGGMSHVDGYIFPCYDCGNPEQQMDDAIGTLSAQGIKFSPKNNTRLFGGVQESLSVGMLWIDVEGGTDYWSDNYDANIDFLNRMANHGEARGVSLGVYSSKYQWGNIAGSSTALSRFPLWYAHYDYDPSYNDFSSFGGWGWPAMKQFNGDTWVCDCSVDITFY